jgi:hypothetical protein
MKKKKKKKKKKTAPRPKITPLSSLHKNAILLESASECQHAGNRTKRQEYIGGTYQLANGSNVFHVGYVYTIYMLPHYYLNYYAYYINRNIIINNIINNTVFLYFTTMATAYCSIGVISSFFI